MTDPRLYYFNPYLQESYSYNDFRSRLFRLNENAKSPEDRYADSVLNSLERKYPGFNPNSTTRLRDWDNWGRNEAKPWAEIYASKIRSNNNPVVDPFNPVNRHAHGDELERIKSNPGYYEELKRAMQEKREPRRSKNNY